MNINDMTIRQAKEIAAMFGNNTPADNPGLNNMLGKMVIVRTYTAGVFFGKLTAKSGTEVILSDARRLWYWHAKKSISLSAVAKYGLNGEKSKICAALDEQWLDAIEIILCTPAAIKSIEEQPDVEAN